MRERWMMRAIIICMLLSGSVSANEGFYLEIGAGKNGVRQDWWTGRDDIGCFLGVGYTWDKSKFFTVDLSYRHSSQCNRGSSLSEGMESTNDSIGIYGRYYVE